MKEICEAIPIVLMIVFAIIQIRLALDKGGPDEY